ncbi:AbrB family transcriptional regulator [Amphritea pacifica]|uniref:AbrB family transcriptional regulator n=1 Tax=Amphritea pacifica TaxID=2811233 RepID=UPI00196307B0|nr:AbrB family transcriptional regulator [Amphritea pacifica]MBN1005231.1 AbrB family transcriptional regulator [Amphritea pacifica]
MLLVVRTMIFGTLGGLLAYWLGLPSAWLIGALLAVVLAGVSGIQVAMPAATSSLITLFLGISVALNIETGLVDQLLHWAGSIVLMCLMLASLLWVLYRYYLSRGGWNRDEALFCSVPGNLAIMLSMAAEVNANVRRISLIHSVRLLFLVFCIPLFLPVAERRVSLQGFHIEHPERMFVTIALAAVIGWILKRVKLPAPMLVGGILATLLLKQGLDWNWRFPDMILVALLVFLGCAIGSRFNNIDIQESIAEIRAAAGGLMITLIISGVFATVLHYVAAVPWTQAMLAYAPGGMEVMIAIAMNQDVDALFVASHQMFRMLIMSMTIPLLMMLIRRKA